MKGKKILILGHARHGKDTLALILASMHGLKYTSSSLAALDIFLYRQIQSELAGIPMDVRAKQEMYQTKEEAFEDRVNHRKYWKDSISKYNTPDKTKLARGILELNNMYVGMRDIDELKASKAEGLFDHYIGIFDPRKPLESKESNQIDPFMHSDIVLINNGRLNDLVEKATLIRL